MNAEEFRSLLLIVPFVAVTACGAPEDNDVARQDTPAADLPVADAAADADGLIDPNEASTAELASVPALDPDLAQQLVDGRPYASMLQIDSILAGRLTEEQRDSVYARVWIPIDLNTASGEEILLIPGVGERMRHEFEEYRPYRGIAEFRREIGKYVDDAEVARLERYVEVR